MVVQLYLHVQIINSSTQGLQNRAEKEAIFHSLKLHM